MADDRNKEGHRQNIKRILNRCIQQRNFKQDQTYLREKKQEVEFVQSNLDTSFNLLRKAQDELEDIQPIENMRVTGLELPRERQVNRLKTIMDRLSDQSRRINFYSALSNHKSSSQRTQFSPLMSRREGNTNKLNQEKLSLPILLNKVKKNKKPANASRNSSLQYLDNKKIKVEEDISYQYLRSQRQKVQQMRRLNVLSRLMGENNKKHLRKLEERRKLLHRNKANTQH